MAKRIIIKNVELGNSGEVSKDKINNNFEQIDKGLDVLDGEAIKKTNITNSLGFSADRVPSEYAVSKEVGRLNSSIETVKTQVANSVAGLIPMGSAEDLTDLNTKPKKANYSYFVKSEKDAYGNPYIYRYDVELGQWINTEKVEYINPRLSEGTVTSNQKLAIDANFLLTIPSGMDIYDDKGTHIRLDKSYDCQLHDGSGRIQFDAENKEFFSSHVSGLDRKCYLIGTYSGQDVQLFNSTGSVTQYGADGTVKDILYRAINDKDILHNAAFSLTCRAGITLEDKTLTLTAGEFYVQLGNGTSKTVKITEPFIHSFSVSSALVVSLLDSKLYVRDNTFGSTDKPRYTDVILINYDSGQGGVFDGILYNFYLNNIGTKGEFLKRNAEALIAGNPVFNIDLSTRTITLETSLDIYFGRNSFVRIAKADFFAEILATGTSRLWYDAEYKTFRSGNPANNNYYLLGTVNGGRIYPRGSDYTIKYSDNSKQKGVVTDTFIKDVVDNVLPDFVFDEAKKAFQRINKNTSGSEISFVLATDLHAGNRNTYKHLGYLAAIANAYGVDFAVNNGDIGVGYNNTTNTEETALELLKKFAIEHSKFNCPVLMAKGNHELDKVDGNSLPEYLLSNYLQRPSQKRFPQIKIVKGQMYGYMDIEAKKARVIFLDSNDNGGVAGGYSYHVTQLQWLIETLNNTPNDYAVIVLSHRFPDQKGDWLSNGQVVDHTGRVKNEMTLKAILSTFVSSSEGISHPDDNLGLSWDFTGSSGLLAGVFCGDSHFDTEVKVDGVNMYCSQGYGDISTLEKPPHAIVTPFDFNTQMLVEVVVIDLENRKVKIYRLGAGGESRDRESTF